jgi:hypothetical protein
MLRELTREPVLKHHAVARSPAPQPVQWVSSPTMTKVTSSWPTDQAHG